MTNSTEQVNELWDKFGTESWIRCIPTIKALLQMIPLTDVPSDKADSIASAASLAASRAFRLGFKIGTAVGHREARRTSLLLPGQN